MKGIKLIGTMLKTNLIIIGLLVGFSSFSQSEDVGLSTLLSLDPSVRYGELKNGFTYYLKENHTPENTISFNLVVKAGASNETTDQLEYAHLLEHLVAKQTRNFPDVKGYFRKIGGFSKAQTRSNATLYQATVPANSKNNIEKVTQILFEWAQGNTWSPESIVVERAAVQGEMRTTDPYRLWLRRIRAKKLAQPMGIRVYNEEDHLKSLRHYNHNALMNYYEKWYQPEQQAVIIVGAIDLDSLEKRIQQLFSKLKKPVATTKPVFKKTDFVKPKTIDSSYYDVVMDSIDHTLRLEIIRKRPNFKIRANSPSDYKNKILERLYKKILSFKKQLLKRDYHPPFESFDPDYYLSGEMSLYIHSSYMSIPIDTNSLKKSIQQGIVAWKQLHQSIQPEDLKKAKQQVLEAFSGAQPLTSGVISQRLQDHFINGKAAPDQKTEGELVANILNEIELNDLFHFIKEYTNLTKNTHFILYKGKDARIPYLDCLEQWIQEVKIDPTETFTLTQTPIPSLKQEISIPTTKALDTLVMEENDLEISTVKLPHNVTLIFKPSAPKTAQFKNRISINAFRPIPVPIQNKTDYIIGQLAPEVIQYLGAGSYNKFVLDLFKQEHHLQLNLTSDEKFQKITGQSNKNDFTKLIDLLYLYLNNPRKDKAAFAAWKNTLIDKMDGKGIRGSSAFVMKKVEAIWYPQLPVIQREDLARLTMEQLFLGLEKSFSTIDGFTFILTGDFDTAAIASSLSRKLTVFPTSNETIPNNEFNFPIKKINSHLTYKNINQVYGRLFFPVKAEKDLKTHIQLELLALALNERIFKRLREGCYAPAARGKWMDFKNNIYAFEIEFDSALGNQEHLVQLALEEFQDLKKNGVTQEWLDTAIKHQLTSYESGFTHFGYFNFWTTYLERKVIHQENMAQEALEYGTLLEYFITLEELNAAAQKYMSISHYQQFLGFPENY